jgi:hypothetical protein
MPEAPVDLDAVVQGIAPVQPPGCGLETIGLGSARRGRNALAFIARDEGADGVAVPCPADLQPAATRLERSSLEPGAQAVQFAAGEGDHAADGVRAPQG